MEKLRKLAPVFFSPTFWGLTLSAVFAILSHYNVLNAEVMEIIYKWLIGVTGVNIVWKGATKISGGTKETPAQ